MTPQLAPIDDRGLTLGVGLFETILFVDGAPRLWAAHAARLREGCAALGLPAPEAHALEDAAREAISAAGLVEGRAAVRLTWTGGSGARGLAPPAAPAPRLLATAARSPDPPAMLALATSTIRRNPTSPTAHLKTLSYLDSVEARRGAVAAGADEALCLDTMGRVACAAAGNVFWIEGERLCTPAPGCGALQGVVRARVLSVASGFGLSPHEVEAEPARLHAAQDVFVTNSLIGCIPVTSLDGAALPMRSTERVRRIGTVAGGGALSRAC